MTTPPAALSIPRPRPRPAGYVAPITAAGAVVWRDRPNGREFVVVHRPRGDVSLPKGKVNPGEPVPAAAVREVWEETRIRIRLGPWLGRTKYQKDGWPKTVDYFSAPAGASDADPFVPTEEIDRMEWVPVDRAARALTRADDAGIARSLADATTTTPVILLRNGSAVDGGKGKDRPLNETGRVQARTIEAVLTAYGAQVLHSANSLRCLETLHPYATKTGTTVRDAKDLRGSHFDIPYALAIVARAIDAAVPTVICAHRAGLHELLTELTRRAHTPLSDPVTIPAAGWIVLHLDRTRLAGMDRGVA